ncbi:MAG: Tad domain-containing protein [Planctomycetaceae bacterium]|nr:Tad domain-containing protein [Planctomycetaceae bacterium]
MTPRPKHGGQILVATLVAMTLLAALVFYVFNVADQVNRRLALQNTADAVAVSGAGWMARSMNCVAMNNCGQSRVIALVPVMDALPLAAKMSADEIDMWEQALAGQLARGIQEPNGGQYLTQGLQSLDSRMIRQRDILRAADVALNNSGFDMATATTWSIRGTAGAPPHGGFWRAGVVLDEMSQTTVASAGALAQANAVEYGKANKAEAATLVPVLPRLPAVRGTFASFRPVMEGRTGVVDQHVVYAATGGNGGAIPDCAVDDSQYRLGPWARLYKWRDPQYRHEGGQFIPGTPGPSVRSGGGSINPGGRSVGSSVIQHSGGSGGHWVGGTSILTGYLAYGPYNWSMRRVGDWANDSYSYDENGQQQAHPGQVPDSYFSSYHSTISRQKLTYMFTDPSAKQLKTIHYPQWIVDYAQCRALAARQDVRISQTLFYKVEVVSSVPPTSAGWMSPGTFRTNGDYPISIRSNGWVDPEQWAAPKICEHIWKDTWTYQTTYDTGIGIQPVHENPADPDSPLTYQDVYVVQWYIFGGIDVGGDIEISDPSNWDAFDSLPAPMLLDRSDGDYVPATPPEAADSEAEYRRRYFQFLGVAQWGNDTRIWSGEFQNPNPLGGTLTAAQAKVFNNSSFDLWTQDWRVRLAPLSGWSQRSDGLDWLSRLDEASRNGDPQNLVTPEQLGSMLKYFRALGSAPDTYGSH